MENRDVGIGGRWVARSNRMEHCGKTGRLVAKLVGTPLFGGSPGAADMGNYEPPAEVVAAIVERDAMMRIRNLAGAFAATRVIGEDLADVADQNVEWLAVMDRSMLAKVMCADDGALKAHIRGERAITGLLAADKEKRGDL